MYKLVGPSGQYIHKRGAGYIIGNQPGAAEVDLKTGKSLIKFWLGPGWKIVPVTSASILEERGWSF